MQAGAPLGIVPLGFDALDMLRIEAGLAFAGHEFCDQTDPFEYATSTRARAICMPSTGERTALVISPTFARPM